MRELLPGAAGLGAHVLGRHGHLLAEVGVQTLAHADRLGAQGVERAVDAILAVVVLLLQRDLGALDHQLDGQKARLVVLARLATTLALVLGPTMTLLLLGGLGGDSIGFAVAHGGQNGQFLGSEVIVQIGFHDVRSFKNKVVCS